MLKPKRVKPEKTFNFEDFVTGRKYSAKQFARTLYGKPKRNPFLEGGLQSIVGRATRAFAARFHGVSPEAIKRLIKAVAEEIELVNVGSKIARQNYAKQTAEDVFKTMKIQVSFLQGNKPDGAPYVYPGFGCNAQCVALAAALRAKGIPAAFIRLGKSNDGVLGIDPIQQGVRHVVVLFSIWGKQFIGNPFERNPEKRMIEFTPEMRARFAVMESKGLLAVGRDSWDLKITSYDKYAFIKKTTFFQTQLRKTIK